MRLPVEAIEAATRELKCERAEDERDQMVGLVTEHQTEIARLRELAGVHAERTYGDRLKRELVQAVEERRQFRHERDDAVARCRELDAGLVRVTRERDEAKAQVEAWTEAHDEQVAVFIKHAMRADDADARAAVLREALERIATADKPQNGVYEWNIFDVADMARAALVNRSEE